MNLGDGNRRRFLRQLFGGAVEQIARHTEERLLQQRYQRPPGAIPELGFLAACTRCGLCAAACPPSAIRYAGTEGGMAAGTPYLDATKVACEACDDMPCAVACPTGALVVPEDGWRRERLGRVVFHPDRCITFQGTPCTACVDHCPVGSRALSLDADGRPVLKLEGCVGCGACVHHCPTSPPSLTFHPLER